jgi:hypothetical protein
MEVSLTEHDIEHGTPSSITHCAFALAIKRAFGEHEVYVYQDSCRVKDEMYNFPPDVRSLMVEYDLNNILSPTTFTLIGA